MAETAPQDPTILNTITTPAEQEARFRHAVVVNTQKIEPGFLPHRATPSTPETPIASSGELKSTDAHIIGEDTFLTAKDAVYAVESRLKPVTGKSIWSRIGEAAHGINPLRRRQQQKAKLQGGGEKEQDLDYGE